MSTEHTLASDEGDHTVQDMILSDDLFFDEVQIFEAFINNDGQPTEQICFELPMLRMFDHARLMASVGLRNASDEISYHNALLECLTLAPHVNADVISLYYGLESGSYCMLMAKRSKVIKGVIGHPDKTVDLEPSSDMLDINSVAALKAFVGQTTPDNTFVDACVNTLGKRGHQVTIHHPTMNPLERLVDASRATTTRKNDVDPPGDGS